MEVTSARLRMVAAALLAAAAGSLAVGGWHALSSALNLLGRYAAWLLFGLAAVNLLRAVIPRGALIGPAVLAAGSAGEFVSQHGWPARLSAPATAAAGLALLALVIVAASPPSRAKTTAIGWVVRRTVRGSTAPAMTVVAVLGLVDLDLTAAAAPVGGITLRCFVLGGRIELRVLARADVQLSPDSTTWLVRVFDAGAEPATGGDPSVRIRLRGAVGGFALRRG
jgi:hypothetical protein